MIEPIKKQKISNSVFLNILKNKLHIYGEPYDFLAELINKRDLYDISGHSGWSSLMVNKDSYNNNEFVIKIGFKDRLNEEFIAHNYFYTRGLTSRTIKYFDCGKYEIMIVEKIDLPLIRDCFDNYLELTIFLAKELRKFHDINLINQEFTKDEYNIFKNKYLTNFKRGLNAVEGLGYLSKYVGNHDIEEIKQYIIENKDILNKNQVLVHGDFNNTNIFIDKFNSIKLIDFKDSGIVNRHCDIFWTMFLIILFNNILENDQKRIECEKLFLNSYGMDKINEEELDYFKKYAFLYWKEHDEITRIENL